MERYNFNEELSRIKNKRIKRSAITVLNELPDYFYEIPASSSGKYHPAYALEKGGLVKHVQVAMKWLEEIFKSEIFGIFDDDTKDLMRMALLLHDGFKSGLTNSGHTVCEHPIIMFKFLLNNHNKLLLKDDEVIFVARLILSHMGKYNTDYNKNEIMPKPQTVYQKIIYLCDLIASREWINVDFEDNKIVSGYAIYNKADRLQIALKLMEEIFKGEVFGAFDKSKMNAMMSALQIVIEDDVVINPRGAETVEQMIVRLCYFMSSRDWLKISFSNDKIMSSVMVRDRSLKNGNV